MADDVSIVVRVQNATNAGIAAVNRSLQRLETSTKDMDRSFGSMAGTALSLAPALLPIAASVAPLIAGMGAATLAVGAFGAAIGPQIQTMNEATKAEGTYTDAVEEHGRSSKEAVKAERAYLDSVAKLPPATREAAAALSILKKQYTDWSDSLAGDTMPVATKAFAVFGALFPKLTPAVKGASQQLDRFVTIAAGGVQSSGFDKFMKSFGEFATTSLVKANNGLVHFARTLDTGKASGGISEFMQYARENGPLVGDTLKNLGEALTNLLVASADTGVGMLTLINALSRLVAAVPPEILTRLLQLALAFKAVKMAAAGMAAVGAAMTVVRTQITAAGVAAIGASTRMGMLTLAFGALSRGAKVAVAGTGIGLLLIALVELSNIGKEAPPNVDKLTSSLGRFARSGKVSGEAARVFGSDLGQLTGALNTLLSPSTGEKMDRWVSDNLKLDPKPLKEARAEVDSLDKSLASLVSSGQGDLAAAALGRIKKQMEESGFSTAGMSAKLDDYKGALEDVAFEQALIAESMGVFGAQSQAVQTKLAAQKLSADGLAQSINALSNAYLMARGGIRGMEAAIDAAAESFKKNGKTLDENTEKGRANGQALDDIAASTMKAAEAARENGSSWKSVNGIYARGRGELIKSAEAMGMTREEARKLAGQILRTPNKTAKLKGNLEDLKDKLADAKARLKRAPSSKTAKLRGDIADLQRKIRAAKDAIAGVKGKTVSVMVQYRSNQNPSDFARSIGGYAHGGVVGAAGGGPRSRRTLVGEQGPEIVDLAPGSRVRSNPDTKRLLAGGHAGGGGQPMVVQLQLDGRQIAEVLIDPMRSRIQSLGGNVQAVLGQQGR